MGAGGSVPMDDLEAFKAAKAVYESIEDKSDDKAVMEQVKAAYLAKASPEGTVAPSSRKSLCSSGHQLPVKVHMVLASRRHSEYQRYQLAICYDRL